MRFPRFVPIIVCLTLNTFFLFAQSPNGNINGLVSDPSSAAVVGAEVVAVNDGTRVQYTTKTNSEGIYVLPSLPPGPYRVQVSKVGFKTIIKPDIVLNIQDALSINFTLPVGAAYEVLTVEGGAPLVNTESAAVSTVIDQTYVKDMPLNGRSFQDLILLTPGVVTQTPQNPLGSQALGRTGEFSVNGQRTQSNYFSVDGVSANVGAAVGNDMTNGSGASGSVAASTSLGTTQALVSVDALQEFRVQSSTYSAEYGRNPGGQFSFVTKSGSNQLHGTAYDYLRNDAVDAQDWFNDYLRAKGADLRQNDFGGTLGGRVDIPGLYQGKDRTFFFISYEGLRLTQPQPAATIFVPSLCLRGEVASCAGGETSAPSPLQPVLNAFPVPNRAEILSACDPATDPTCPPSGQKPTGAASYIGNWSNPNSIDSTSIRLDHALNNQLKLFFRFGDARSSSANRALDAPSEQTTSAYTLRTYTVGATSILSNSVSNDFRINYSSNYTTGLGVIDSFGGGTPVNFRELTGIDVAVVTFDFSSHFVKLAQEKSSGAQRQWNLVNTVSLSLGRHQFKFGGDYRRLAPFAVPSNPFLEYDYYNRASVETNSPDLALVEAQAPAYPLFTNFSAFAQDEWKLLSGLALSFGLRWEVNPAPGVTRGLSGYTIQGSDPSTWKLAPQGTPLWRTTWYNFAPRLGIAYTLHNIPGRETVLRGGGGIFFDTGQQEGASSFSGVGFSAFAFLSGPFPGTPATSVPPIVNPPATPYNFPTGFAPHLQLPYTLQWNASVEQALGQSQALTISYVGSHASRLLLQRLILTPTNPNASDFFIFENGLTSHYDSLQLQLQRRQSHGLAALASYTWSHCVDYGSEDYNLGYQRGNCDMDIRENLSAAFSYDLPNAGQSGFANAVLSHWGLDDRFTARTSFPITLTGNLNALIPGTNQPLFGGLDLVPKQPIYIYGSQCASVYAALFNSTLSCPGGRAINPNAFAQVPVDPNTGFSTRLGNAPRNFARGFGAWQMDFAVRRDFMISERIKLQFRAEAFNIFNHPNFGVIDSTLGSNTFGQATATLAQSLGILSPLYQMGGSRSMQFALKLAF